MMRLLPLVIALSLPVLAVTGCQQELCDTPEGITNTQCTTETTTRPPPTITKTSLPPTSRIAETPVPVPTLPPGLPNEIPLPGGRTITIPAIPVPVGSVQPTAPPQAPQAQPISSPVAVPYWGGQLDTSGPVPNQPCSGIRIVSDGLPVRNAETVFTLVKDGTGSNAHLAITGTIAPGGEISAILVTTSDMSEFNGHRASVAIGAGPVNLTFGITAHTKQLSSVIACFKEGN